MAFFFPWLGAFYCGKIARGLVLLVIDWIFMAMSLIGIRLFFLLLHGPGSVSGSHVSKGSEQAAGTGGSGGPVVSD